MILCLYALQNGGVETYYYRLASEYLKQKNEKITLILLNKNVNSDFYDKFIKVANVCFYSDFLYGRSLSIPISIHALFPFKNKNKSLFELLKDKSIAHVATGFEFVLIKKILCKYGLNIPVTMGMYHIKEFSFKVPNKMPYFEKTNRTIFRELKRLRILFNDTVSMKFNSISPFNIDDSTVFPIGIDIKENSYNPSSFGNVVSICSIGRLVRFKTYNLWMLNVIRDLIDNGNKVNYHIYGYGELDNEIKNKIDDLGLNDSVFLMGEIDYSDFSRVVSKYNLFIGSGTALLESAACGVPSIIAIESIQEPYTYGYISDVPGISYNTDDMYKKVAVADIIESYCKLNSDGRKSLSNKNYIKAKEFSISNNIKEFDLLKNDDPYVGRYNYYIYLFSFNFILFASRFNMVDWYKSRYE
ncbi:glycosyltransferase [Aliivibrio fischeri]|uniref:Glycosyl transferase family 1 domain-containing protein n=1 Tax=Aliivibrio fischeri TaxID=668 RepID=A0A510UPB0_ALIFS|nr:glycosyltransferase [Aliivibrio fischeri]GEK15080.1 hypothetical protein AFI02nite_31160 [Aliivibrio fischeri]